MKKFKEMVEAKLNGESAKDLVSGINIHKAQSKNLDAKIAAQKPDYYSIHQGSYLPREPSRGRQVAQRGGVGIGIGKEPRNVRRDAILFARNQQKIKNLNLRSLI